MPGPVGFEPIRVMRGAWGPFDGVRFGRVLVPNTLGRQTACCSAVKDDISRLFSLNCYERMKRQSPFSKNTAN